MRKGILAAVLSAAVLFAGAPAEAQMKIPGVFIPRVVRVNPNRVQLNRVQPNINRVRPNIKAPNLQMIPPSAALRRVQAMVPQGQVIGVKLKGPVYVVKVKQGNRITQVQVNAATGALSP